MWADVQPGMGGGPHLPDFRVAGLGGILQPPALMTLGGRKDRRKVGQVALGSHHPFEGGNLARVCDQVESPKLGHVCECWGGGVAGRAGQGAPAPDVRDAQRGKVWVWPPAEGVASVRGAWAPRVGHPRPS